MLSDGIFVCSCLNKFLPFRISFNTDVFIVIISFLVLCSVFIESNPKMFVIGLLSEFLDYRFKSFPYFFSIPAVIQNMNNCFIIFIASITNW